MDMETLTLYDALLYGSITAVTLIVVISYFPGNPGDYPLNIGEEEAEALEERKKKAQAAEEEKLQLSAEERKKAEEELIARHDARQDRLKRAGIDMDKVRRLLDEAEEAEANARVPTRVLMQAMKGLIFLVFFLGLLVLAKYFGMDWKYIFSKEIAVLEGAPKA